jgi:hypothetical protein
MKHNKKRNAGCGNPSCTDCADLGELGPGLFALVPLSLKTSTETWAADMQTLARTIFNNTQKMANAPIETALVLLVPQARFADALTAMKPTNSAGEPRVVPNDNDEITVLLRLPWTNDEGPDAVLEVGRRAASSFGARATAVILETEVSFSLSQMLRENFKLDDVEELEKACIDLNLPRAELEALMAANDSCDVGNAVLLLALESGDTETNGVTLTAKINGDLPSDYDALLQSFGVPLALPQRTLTAWGPLSGSPPSMLQGFLPAVTPGDAAVTPGDAAVTPGDAAVTPPGATEEHYAPAVTPTDAFAWANRNNGGAHA